MLKVGTKVKVHIEHGTSKALHKIDFRGAIIGHTDSEVSPYRYRVLVDESSYKFDGDAVKIPPRDFLCKESEVTAVKK